MPIVEDAEHQVYRVWEKREFRGQLLTSEILDKRVAISGIIKEPDETHPEAFKLLAQSIRVL